MRLFSLVLPHDPARSERWANVTVYCAAAFSALFAGGVILIMGMYVSGAIQSDKMPYVVVGWGIFCVLDALVQDIPTLFRARAAAAATELDWWTSVAAAGCWVVALLIGLSSPTPLGYFGWTMLAMSSIVAIVELLQLEILTTP